MPKSNDYPHKNKIVSIVLVSLLLCLAYTFVVYESYMKFKANESEIAMQSSSEAASAEKALTIDFFSRLDAEVVSLGQMLEVAGSDDESISLCFARKLGVSKADRGLFYRSDGSASYGDAALSAQFFETAQKVKDSGSIALSNMKNCEDGVVRFGIAAPFYTTSGTAVIMLLYPQTVLSQTFENREFAPEGKVWLADSNGKFVAGESKLPSWIKEETYSLDLKGAEQGMILTINPTDGTVYYAYANSVGINNLSTVYMVQKDLIDKKAQVGIEQIYFFGSIALISLLIMLSSGVYFYNVRANNLKLYQKKFKIAISQSARAAFEYDKRTDRLMLISECEYICLPKPFISLSELSDLVHPYDKGLYGQAVAELRIDGTTSKTVRVSHFAGTDDYKWYNVTATRLTDKGEGRALTIGTVEDIDEREKERLVLYERATTDCLTGLCNRAETERTINMRLGKLEENEHSAFALLDLDDFKCINDEFGHDYGDKALIFFSEKLRATFRFGDVIGRIGGDEFVVYMTLTSSQRVVEQRLKELMDNLKMPPEKDFVSEPIISCSAGCCMASKGDTFDFLYRRADNALYESKNHGKAQAVID